jgi:hypothetical protein
MPRVEFEPTIPVLERAKAVYAFDRAATLIGSTAVLQVLKSGRLENLYAN